MLVLIPAVELGILVLEAPVLVSLVLEDRGVACVLLGDMDGLETSPRILFVLLYY